MKEFQAIKQGNGELKLCKVVRRDNSLAHSLAKFWHRMLRGGFMQGAVPTFVFERGLARL